MSNRREFLQSCAAIAGGLAASGVLADGSIAADRLRPSRAIFDEEFAESRAFARAARDLGMATRAITGDVTSLWYNDLYFQWRDRSGSIAGLTGASALFCLERLAWDAGQRVVVRVDHAPASAGGLRHTFLGPREMQGSSLIEGPQPSLGARMAQLAAQCPARSGERVQRVVVDAAGSADRWCEPLVSWVIGPRSVA